MFIGVETHVLKGQPWGSWTKMARSLLGRVAQVRLGQTLSDAERSFAAEITGSVNN